MAEKKLNWESRHLNLRAGDQQKPDYVKLDPNAVAAKLKDAKAQEFVDVTILKELESEGFFARLEKP